MRIRRKKYQDPATRKLQEEGLLNFKKQDGRGTTVRKIKEFGKITYDFWSGVKYIVFLSAILWWIPLFGPMLAGYVGGRRTGGPKKGIIASIVGLGIIAGVYYLLTQGYVYLSLEAMLEYPDKFIALATSHYFFGPYLEFFQQYWVTFFDRIWAGVPFGSNSYILTIIFAYIGGIISYEKRKEFTDGVRSLDQIKEEMSSLHRYAKNPMQKRGYETANKNYNRLGDLRSVQYRGQPDRERSFADIEERNGSNQRDSSRRKKMKEEAENFRQNYGQRMFENERAVPKREVRHHSKSDGDDWEFL